MKKFMSYPQTKITMSPTLKDNQHHIDGLQLFLCYKIGQNPRTRTPKHTVNLEFEERNCSKGSLRPSEAMPRPCRPHIHTQRRPGSKPLCAAHNTYNGEAEPEAP